MNKAVEQFKQFWNGLAGKQRALLVGGALVSVAVLLVFAKMIGSPDYKPLLTGLEPADAQAMAAQLDAKNIPHQMSADGKTLSVPADQVDAARLDVASQGMPHSGRLGFELFDKVSWGQTEFDEKVNYQRAMEGELERTIQTLRDVESARVHLVMPTDSVFSDRQRDAKASVILKLRHGSLSAETQMAIARLVSGAVDDLKPQNVSVIDADTNRPLGNSESDSSGAAGIEQQLSNRLMATLEPVVGAQRLRASVNVEYDPSSSEENEEKYDPNGAVALSTQKSEELIGAGAAVGGVPGTSSNVPTAAKQPATTVENDDDNTQHSKSESNTYGVSKLVKHTINPAGRVRRVTVALLIDDAVVHLQKNGKTVDEYQKRTPEELKQIEELAKNAIGLDPSRGDSLTVQNLSFDRSSATDLASPGRIQKLRNTLNDWSSYVRYGALLLLFVFVYIVMLRPIQRQAIATFKKIDARQQAEAALLNSAGSDQLLTSGQRTAVLKKQLLDKVKTEPANTARLVQNLLREERA